MYTSIVEIAAFAKKNPVLSLYHGGVKQHHFVISVGLADVIVRSREEVVLWFQKLHAQCVAIHVSH